MRSIETMSATPDKAVTLPKWDGEEKSFQVWWMRFQAYAKVHKFKEALGEKPEPDLPRSDSIPLQPTRDIHKPRIEANKRNETALACLTMAITNEEQLGLIYEAMTNEYPDGLAYLVVQQLLQKYKPQDTIY